MRAEMGDETPGVTRSISQYTSDSVGENLQSDGPLIQHSMEVPAVTFASDIVERLNPLTLEDESLLTQKDQKKANFLNEMQHLRHRIGHEVDNNMVQSLIFLLQSLKDLERKESDFRSYCKQKRSDMQAEVLELENQILNSNRNKSPSNHFDHSLSVSLGKLNSAKSALSAKLRTNLLLKRQLGDVPSQTELIQYEHRFSELYVQIQEKLRQTRKYYDTYNALLEIKELMLKETSLLNSIISQFQDALTSTTGRTKLIDSMEGILKGIQQKLEKVQLSLHAEQKICDAFKQKYAAAIAEQRHRSSLLKAFQDECARTEQLRSLTSM
ncbi:paramyosin-like protein isoform X2 [Tasmannia lanceolata]|uniref:paramyosin-like protein isoform X2 n=1 Tax=Tasmannia lanceolata TaxID=3420 RepID=UPI0040648071